MEFSVIDHVPGLSVTERQIATESGPPFVEAPDDYGTLLARSDWRVVDRIDVTAAFARLALVLVNGTSERKH
jgi:hypothetical protein